MGVISLCEPVANAAVTNHILNGLLGKDYLVVKHSGFPEDLRPRIVEATLRAFNLPTKSKLEMSKKRGSHFLGFSGYGSECTNGKFDRREVFDFASEPSQHSGQNTGSDYEALVGPNQWPDRELVGLNFRPTIESYLHQMRKVYLGLLLHLEDALQLPAGALTSLDTPEVQHRLKLIKYFPGSRPDVALHSVQGVGAHQDETGWLTFVQELDEQGLQVHLQNASGWVQPVLPTDGWGLNVGKAFERGTNGIISSTLHRVQAPSATPRHSIVFFAGLPLDMAYSTLAAVLCQSPVLHRAQSTLDCPSREYLDILHSLDCAGYQGDTFGSTQLKMWQQSYALH